MPIGATMYNFVTIGRPIILGRICFIIYGYFL